MEVWGWFVPSVFDRLLNAASAAWASRLSLENELQSLTAQLSKIRPFLGGSQSTNPIDNEHLRQSFEELRQLIYDADDLLEECEYYSLKDEREGAAPSSSSVFQSVSSATRRVFRTERIDASESRRKRPRIPVNDSIEIHRDNLSLRMKELVKKLEETGRTVYKALKMDKLENISRALQPVLTVTNPHETTSYPIGAKVFGRDGDRDRIVGIFKRDDIVNRNLSVLSIVGGGGVGKTTLAQMVFKDGRSVDHFGLRMWIPVSRNFDGFKLTEQMLEYLPKELRDGERNFNRIQETLHHYLKSKRVLVVFDDMWEMENRTGWERLLAPLRLGEKNGNVILVTTRSSSVSRMIDKNEEIKLDGLNEDKFWLLFKACAFGNENYTGQRNLEKIGKEIAKKLKGYPLAAKTVGALLKRNHNVQYWRRVHENEEWETEKGIDDIMPALMLSYKYLPPHLQQCFSYCSLFPKNYKFDKKELVRVWLAQGFVHSKDMRKRLEHVAEDYVFDLVDLGFFQNTDDEPSGNSYDMHDLMHDLARAVSFKECLTLDGSEFSQFQSTIRHLSIITEYAYARAQNSEEVNEKFKKQLLNVGESLAIEKLRTLILIGRYNTGFVETFKSVFHKARTLRVLRLCIMSYNVQNLCSNLANFIHLRYLRLHSDHDGNRYLPSDLCSLYYLQVLDTREFINLPSLPDGIVNLTNLRLILTSNEMVRNIAGIGKLTRLQELREFCVKRESGFELAQLKDLNDLEGSLAIHSLENVQNKEEARNARLTEKKYLYDLSLLWSRRRLITRTSTDKDVLDGLQPHSYLTKLSIIRYGGTGSPSWLGSELTLDCLESLRLEDCEAWVNVPPLGQLPSLKHLHLTGLSAVRELRREFYGNGQGMSFPSLEKMELINMLNLRAWEGNTGQDFPCLKELLIRDCPELRGLPFAEQNVNNNSSQAQNECKCRVTIEGCPLLQWSVLSNASIFQTEIPVPF